MVLVAYSGPVRPAAALRDSVLSLPTGIHSLLVNKSSVHAIFNKSLLGTVHAIFVCVKAWGLGVLNRSNVRVRVLEGVW